MKESQTKFTGTSDSIRDSWFDTKRYNSAVSEGECRKHLLYYNADSMYFKFISEKKWQIVKWTYIGGKGKIKLKAGISKFKLQNQYQIQIVVRNLIGEENLPEHNIVHRLWIAVRVFLHSELDVVGAPHAAHRDVELTVGEEGDPAPHPDILEGLSWKTVN